MDLWQTADSDTGALFIPPRGENVNFPVTTYFLDLSQMYMGAIRWHWHDEIEFIIANNGRANLLIDDVCIEMQPGFACMINQGILHSIRPIDNEKFTFYSFIFHPSFLFGYGATLFSTKYLTPIISSPSMKYLILEESVPWQEEMIDHVNNAIAATLTKKFGYELIARAEISLCWAKILEHCMPTEQQQEEQTGEISQDSNRVKQAILYIEKHHMEPITLDDIAASIHVSKSECCRCFKRTLRITPIEYVMRYRIFEATRKIKRKDAVAKSISSLAMSVGFNNASYFNKLFKKYVTCTPSQYKDFLKRKPAANTDAPFSLPSPFQQTF